MPRVMTRSRLLLGGLLLIGLVGGLVLLDSIVLQRRWQAGYHFPVGKWESEILVDGVFDPEHDGYGVQYRWSNGASTIRFSPAVAVGPALFDLQSGGIPPGAVAPRPSRLTLNGQPWLTVPVQATPRHYALILPLTGPIVDQVAVSIQSPTSSLPSDNRRLGIRLDTAGVSWIGRPPALPLLRLLAAQWLVAVLGTMAAARLGAPPKLLVLVTAGLVLFLMALLIHDLMLVRSWVERTAVAAIAILAAAHFAPPLVARFVPGWTIRQVRVLVAVTLLAIAIRIVGMLNPAFATHDQWIHNGRLSTIQTGWLFLTDRPTEFGSKTVIVPALYYLLVQPLTLVFDNPIALMLVQATFDGTAALLIALFVQRLGGTFRAAISAALLMSMMPIQLTAVWWGFAPQVWGQSLILAVAVVAAGNSPRGRTEWLTAGTLFTAALMSHNGIAALGGLWLAGYIALTWLRDRANRAEWLGWTLVVVGATAVAVATTYVDAIQQFIAGLAQSSDVTSNYDTAARIRELLNAIPAAVTPLGLALPAAGIAWLLARVCPRQRRLLGAWLASSTFFWLVDMVRGLQVRYAYFAIPVVVAGVSMLLDRLMARGRWNRVAVWCLLAFAAWTGLQLWYLGTVWFVKAPIMPLTH
ncbi:MAG: hypothetical protein NVSMB42_01350 [Herpetosiphon sp.]